MHVRFFREPLQKICKNLISTDIKESIGSLYKNENHTRTKGKELI